MYCIIILQLNIIYSSGLASIYCLNYFLKVGKLGMEQSIEEWTHKNMWKTGFKNLEVISSD